MTTHIEPETLELLYKGQLSLDQQLEVLEHLSVCSYCAMQFASITEKQELIHAPRNMKESVMEKANSLPVQLNMQTNILSKKMELFTYSLKVSAAVICTLFLLGFVYTPDMIIEKPEANISQEIKEKTNNWVSNFNEFSNNIFDKEDKQHD